MFWISRQRLPVADLTTSMSHLAWQQPAAVVEYNRWQATNNRGGARLAIGSLSGRP